MLGIIINPKSGKKAFRAQRIFLWKLLRKRHQPFAYRLTKYAGHAIELARGGPNNVPAGQWDTVRALESGSVLLEMKDGKWEPLGPEDILSL